MAANTGNLNSIVRESLQERTARKKTELEEVERDLKDLASAEEDEFEAKLKTFIGKHGGINTQDKQGNTLAHRMTFSGHVYDFYKKIDIMFQYNPDFTIANKEGMTPMHLAAVWNRKRYQYQIFRQYVAYAAKKQFDFAALDGSGKAVLHYAAYIISEQCNIKIIIDAVKEHNLKTDYNVISASGKTTLFYLINHQRFYEAKLLLQEGARPAGNVKDSAEYAEAQKLLAQLKEEQNELCGGLLKDIEEEKNVELSNAKDSFFHAARRMQIDLKIGKLPKKMDKCEEIAADLTEIMQVMETPIHQPSSCTFQ